jgi:hypothetical protein
MEMLTLSVPEKHKKAMTVIKEQSEDTTIAGRMGQHVRIDRTAGRVRIGGVFWYAPQNDRTIPTTDADKATCAQEIVAAMRDTTNCKEQTHTMAFQNHWGATSTFYTTEELQEAAWDLVVSSNRERLHIAEQLTFTTGHYGGHP